MIELKQLFSSSGGTDLELCYLHQIEDGVPFVSRTANNNGISAWVEEVDNIPANPANTISVSMGGSVMEAFVQSEPYYSGRDIKILTPRCKMNSSVLQFYCMCIRANKYKYCFGLQANKTLDSLMVPDLIEIPSWALNKDLPDVTTIPDYFLEEGYKKACWYLDNIDQQYFETDYRAPVSDKKVDFRGDYSQWKGYKIGGSDGLFNVMPGKRLTKSDQHEGETVFLGATRFNNGITGYIDAEPLYSGPCLTVNYNGSVGEAFYQEGPFWNCDDVKAWLPKFSLNKYIAMYLIAIIELQKQHYNYGIKWNQTAMEKTIIKLPSKKNPNGKYEPDWDYMERYIKSLPFSSAL